MTAPRHRLVASIVLLGTFCGCWGFTACPPPRLPSVRAGLARGLMRAGGRWGGGESKVCRGGKGVAICCSAALGTQEELKRKILDLTEGTGAGVEASPEIRAQVDSLIADLCSANPTPEPANSNLLDGRWRVRYSTAPPPSNGQLGPFIGSAFQNVNLKQGVYENLLIVGDEESGGWLKAVLKADWEVVDSSTWTVFFRSLDLMVFGFTVVRQRWEENTRVWDMAYLDRNTRVVGSNPSSLPPLPSHRMVSFVQL
jgi:hypothetical protein